MEDSYQQACIDAIQMLEAAGCGAPGKPNTLRAMLREGLNVPGDWYCPKCKFQQHFRILRASDGAVGISNESPGPCPNDGEEMLPVTWKMAAGDAEACIERLMGEQEVLKIKAEERDWIQRKLAVEGYLKPEMTYAKAVYAAMHVMSADAGMWRRWGWQSIRQRDSALRLLREAGIAPEACQSVKNETEVMPIPMLLFCPNCGNQHIDAPNEAIGWTDPPHKSHECQHCKHTWRPCDLPTRGVPTIHTKGKNDGRPSPRFVQAMPARDFITKKDSCESNVKG